MNKTDEQHDKKQADEIAEELIKLISNNIVDINNKNSTLRYYYEKLGWETETSFIIDEGLEKFGIALAMLEIDLKEYIKEDK